MINDNWLLVTGNWLMIIEHMRTAGRNAKGEGSPVRKLARLIRLSSNGPGNEEFIS
jgi:hypothetical protein